MRRRRLLRALFFTLVAVFFLSPLIFFRNIYESAPGHRSVLPYTELKKPGHPGEKVIYEVHLGKLSLGRSVFTTLADEELEGRPVSVVRFETKLARFADTEKIYCDPVTYLPLRVERLVNMWPTTEKITEDYDQKDFKVVVSKIKGNRKEPTLVIKKGDVINNAILLPFYLRKNAALDIGYSLIARLPTKEFSLRLVSKEEVVVPAGRFVAYKFTSTPRQFEIWISDDSHRVPLKIKGSSSLGYTLEMREYHGPPQ